ncbi:sodium:solute symporter family protein [Brevibacterium salitolerans]|uniref:Proline permease n=1 Tax=Brevibacterium salitolerans TaxID=1403566 RepID=A0ABP5I6J1_9MICO
MGSVSVVVIIVVYFAVMFAIGLWANRRTKSSKEFLVAGQSLGFFVMAIASFSSIQSGWGMVGNTGAVYDIGISALLGAAMLVPLGFALAWFLLGARLHRAASVHGAYSVPDLVKVRYRSRSAHTAMSAAMAVGAVAYMTSQISAMGIIASLLLGTSVQTGAWIGAAVVAIYTVAGGMLAAVWTDLIQGLLMIVMSVAVFFLALFAAGGWSSVLLTTSAADPDFLSLTGPQSEAFIFGYMALLLFGAAGQPQLITKFLMLKDRKELKWGALVSGLAYGVTTLFSLGIGLSLKAMVLTGSAEAPATIDNTTTDFLSQFTSPAVAGLALTALLAAVMSSASSFITIGAAAVVRDLATALGVRVERELLWSRVMSAVITVLAVLLVFYLSQAIFILGAIGWAAFAAAILGPIGIGIHWRRATGAAATAAVAVALGFNLLIVLLEASGLLVVAPHMHIGGISLMLSVVVFVCVSLLTPRERAEQLFREFDAAACPDGTSPSPGRGAGVPQSENPEEENAHRAVGILVGAVTSISAIMLAGMLFDLPDLIIYPTPLMVGLVMMLGCLGSGASLSAVRVPLLGYTAVLLILMTAMAATRDSSVLFGGLPLATGILVYVLWPFSTLSAGLLYAWIYSSVLRRVPAGALQEAAHR